jgi:hypothetical protein
VERLIIKAMLPNADIYIIRSVVAQINWGIINNYTTTKQPSLLVPSKLGRLEMKPHEPKKPGQNKGEKERRKRRAIKNQRRKC